MSVHAITLCNAPASGSASVSRIVLVSQSVTGPKGADGAGVSVATKEAGTTVVAVTTGLNFKAGFDVAESPSGTANVDLDLTEYEGGALPVAVGGTAATDAATARANLGAAPLTPSFVTLGTNGELTNERVLTAGTGITLTDDGAGSTLTIASSASGGVGPVIEPPSGCVAIPGQSTGYAYTLSFGHSANDCLFMPFIVYRALTITGARSIVTSSGAAQTNRVSIYSSATSGMPSALVATLGTMDVGSTGTKTITGLSQALQPGIYWTCVQASNGASTLRAFLSTTPSIIKDTMTANNQVLYLYGTQSYGSSAPSTPPSLTAATGSGDQTGWSHLVLYTWTNT